MRLKEKESNTASGGVGFFGLLTVLFIGLKLTKVISWSWWWILAPMWGPIAIALVLLVIYILIQIRANK